MKEIPLMRNTLDEISCLCMKEKGSRHMSGEGPKVEKLSKVPCLAPCIASPVSSSSFHISVLIHIPFPLNPWKGEYSIVLAFVTKNRSYSSTPIRLFQKVEILWVHEFNFLVKALSCYCLYLSFLS